MAISLKYLVLCLYDTFKSTHKNAAFTGKITVNLFLEGCWEEISGAYRYTDSQCALFGSSGSILENSVA